MRLREAILADLPRLSREAEACDKINIQDGTKGGSAGASASRWITVDHGGLRWTNMFKARLDLHSGSRPEVAAT